MVEGWYRSKNKPCLGGVYMNTKKCEHCGEEIHIKTKKCPFCGEIVEIPEIIEEVKPVEESEDIKDEVI